MKKTLLALAVLGAFAGAASAQTAVTIYGSVDGGIRNLTNAGAAGANSGDSLLGMSKGIVSSGISNSNRLGFKGVEDLGGGMNAHFVLESGFILGTGNFTGASPLLFSRQALVGVGGDWGTVDLGRQYSIALKQLGSYDPFLYKFPTIVPLAFAASADPSSGGRFNNDIQYTGKFGPVTARAEYAVGEQAGNRSNGSAQGVGVDYTGGPFSVGAVYTKRKSNNGTAALPVFTGNNDQWLIGGAYTQGPFRVAGGYIDEKQDGVVAGNVKIKNAWLGGSYSIAPAMKLTAGFYRTKNTLNTGADGKRDLLIVAGTYAVSKRTEFYVEADQARFNSNFSNQYTASPIGLPGGNAAGLNANGQLRQVGVSVGVNHLF